jgi:hypothetical protein
MEKSDYGLFWHTMTEFDWVNSEETIENLN